MPGGRKLKEIGETYEYACSYAQHSDSGDSVQESGRVINSAYEITLNLGHPTPPAEDSNRRELRSGRSHHMYPFYQASLPPTTSMTQRPSYIFGGGHKTSIWRQIAHTLEAIQKNAPTRPIWKGMVEANQLAADCIKTLRDTNWVENSQMSEDNLKEFLEFLFFEFHITEKTRRSSLALNFKPESKVVDFVSELKVKMQEQNSNMDITPAVAVPIQLAFKISHPCHY